MSWCNLDFSPFLKFVKYLSHFCFKRGNIIGCHEPDFVDVDPKVTMDEFIPRTRYILPRNVGILMSEIGGEVFYGFPNNLGLADYSILNEIALLKSMLINLPQIFFNPNYSIHDVSEINGFIALHKSPEAR